MFVQFVIHYHVSNAHGNVQLHVSGHAEPFTLSWSAGDWWTVRVPYARLLPHSKNNNKIELSYSYSVGDSLRETPLHTRSLSLLVAAPCTPTVVRDVWRAADRAANALLTSAFTRAVFHRAQPAPALPAALSVRLGDAASLVAEFKVRFRLLAAQVPPSCVVGLVGSADALGKWGEPRLLSDARFPLWEADVELGHADAFEYKYVLVDAASRRIVEWEHGANRRFACAEVPRDPGVSLQLVLHDESLRLAAAPWRGGGVAVPVFSLRQQTEGGKGNSTGECGVGDFGSLVALVEWAATVGLRMVQVLPINDTVTTYTFRDSYPYAAVSVNALHPLYLHLTQLGELSDPAAKAAHETERRRLNALPEIDYDGVIKAKLAYARAIYTRWKATRAASKAAPAAAEAGSFDAFVAESRTWLRPYAVFAALRDEHGTPDTNKWGRLQHYPGDAAIEREWQSDAAQFHAFLQWHLDAQLQAAAARARQLRVVLKGDIPIGIFRHSVDAWLAPHLYNMNVSAGAPPDDFAVLGQNWGFPTYNWHEMAKDNYLWWRQRLQHMARYFDAFRIDHILGFFRIWQIPTHAVDGLLGQFEPQLALEWHELRIGNEISEQRLCEPFVTDHELWRLFGTEWARARQLFFGEQRHDGTLAPLPHVATQRAVDDFVGQIVAELTAALAACDAADRRRLQNDIEWHEAARQHMFALLRNVVLLRAGHGRYVPRIAMADTRSFECLQPAWAKEQLRSVYVDFFYHRNEALWAKEARKKLPALCAATDMLVCGEDLGMVPHCVPQVMRENDILSLEVQRMPKDQKIKLGHPSNAPYLSVVTPSSHDTSTLRGWWQELSWDDRHLAWRFVGGQGDTPAELHTPQLALFLWQHMHSPAMWCVFPIQELLAFAEWRVRPGSVDDERINVPANPAHYWRYRMHVALDELRKDAEFTDRIVGLHHYTGREH